MEKDIETEWEEIMDSLYSLKIRLDKYLNTKETAMVRTKIDEAILWWVAERGFIEHEIKKFVHRQ